MLISLPDVDTQPDCKVFITELISLDNISGSCRGIISFYLKTIKR